MAVLDNIALEGRVPYGIAAGLGVVLHVTCFRVGEWNRWIPRTILFFIALYGVVVFALIHYPQFHPQDLLSGLIEGAKLFASLLAGIFASIAVYRLFLHPLRHFPGPQPAKLTSLYATRLSLRRLQFYQDMRKIHETYGPNEISIANAAALKTIHSNQSTCFKGPWYDLLLPLVSVHTTRDKKEHARRRKVWDKGFSAKALRDYEPRVKTYTQMLLNKIQDSTGKPLDASLWMNFYGFDVMGDLAFGKSFNMLRDGIRHEYMTLMHKNTIVGSLFGRFPWALMIFKEIPILNYTQKNFLEFLKGEVKSRMEHEPDLPDVFSWILDAYRSNPNKTHQDFLDLHGDANLIVVAGSDTTAASMTFILFELARNPEIFKKLRQEVDEFYAANEEPDHLGLSKLKYLQAVIDEVLRIHPAVPSGVQRLTPPEGIHIGETFIPGNTIVQVPLYTVARDERSFVDGDKFIPERWTTRPELIKDATAFAPFQIGRYSCVGKHLGLMEIRCVISQIVRLYDFTFAPGQTPEAFVDGIVDGFTVVCPKLDMVFTPRQAVAGT